MQLWPCCATHRGALQLASTPWPGTMWAMTSANHCLTAASSRVPGKAGCRQPGPLVWQWVGQLVRNAAWVLRRGARASIMAWCGGWGRVIHASLISRNEPPPVASRRRKAWRAHTRKKRGKKERKKEKKKKDNHLDGVWTAQAIDQNRHTWPYANQNASWLLTSGPDPTQSSTVPLAVTVPGQSVTLRPSTPRSCHVSYLLPSATKQVSHARRGCNVKKQRWGTSTGGMH